MRRSTVALASFGLPATTLAVLFLSLSPRSASAAPGDLVWSIPFASGRSQPVLADGVLYVGSKDGQLLAVDAGTGAKRWTYRLDDSLAREISVPAGATMAQQIGAASAEIDRGIADVEGTPVVSGDRVFVSAFDNRIHAVDRRTGVGLWTLREGTADLVVADDSTLLAVTQFPGKPFDRALRCLDAATGRERWVSHVNFIRGVVVLGDRVFVSTSKAWSNRPEVHPPDVSHLDALDLATGAVRWTLELEGPDVSPPAVSDSVIFVSTKHGDGKRGDAILHALAIADGRSLWTATAPCHDFAFVELRTPQVEHDLLLFASDRELQSLDLRTGTLRWSHSVGAIESPVMIDGTTGILCARGSGLTKLRTEIRAVDLRDGSKRWSHGMGTSGGALESVGGGYVFASMPALLGGMPLRVLRAVDGDDAIHLSLKGHVTAPPTCAGGRMFAAVADDHGVGALCSIECGSETTKH